MSIGEEAEKRRKKIRKLKKARRLLALGEIKSTELAVKSAKSQSIDAQQYAQQDAQEQTRKRPTRISLYDRYVR